LKFVAFPDTDGDYIETRILMPQGTPLEHTEAVVEQLTGALEKVNSEFTPLQPDGQDLVRTVTVQYNQNSSAGEQGPHVATVVADLLSAEIRTGRIDDYLAWWRDLAGIVPDAVSIIYTQSSTRVAGQPIELKLKGDDLDQLKAAARDLQVWFGQFKGVHNLSDDLRSGKPEVKIRLRETASILGVTGQMIASQLRTAYYGTTVTDIQVGPESYEIYVRLDHRDRDSLDDLDDFHITLAGGKQVPIKVVALFETGRGYSSIPRLDGQRTVTVQGDIDTATANASELLSKFKKEYLAEFVQRFKGVTVLVEGQSKETAKTGFSMARAFMIGVVGIFVLLSFQFRSYLEPFVVMVAIPLSLIGAIWGHIFMGLDFCMPSMIGFFSLAGIVVNDSILLVEFIKLRRREGMSIAAAACQASRQRFRAVLLTSVTTIAGLLPLLSEKSRQAQSLIPLSASIVFGLMASTILVLLVVPALYTILGDLGIAAKIEVGAEQQEG
ncbi:MAG: efflux RND transporter permease subunit, partial [Gemmatimonadota bacterium]|nr:efflux RND transporter permease subunit [Gemmatimonadota bacterium]